MDDLITFLKEQAASHWPFLLMSFMFGLIGQFAKNRVWTKTRASRGGWWWWARATLPLHAPLSGLLFGAVAWLAFRETFPSSPGVQGMAGLMLYYAGAGALSAWVFNAIRHFAHSKGLAIPEGFEDSESIRSSETSPPSTPMSLGPNDVTPHDPPLKFSKEDLESVRLRRKLE